MKLQEFKDNALNNLQHSLNDGDIEGAKDSLKRFQDCRKNEGYDTKRLNFNTNDLENVFHTKWIEENLPCSGINGGRGVLQDLMSHHNIEVTDRERKIVASVIQWLGTNCGKGFLETILDKPIE